LFGEVFVFEAEFGSITQTGLELNILLPQPPQCRYYKCVPPYLARYFHLEKSSIPTEKL
jgi:hypothetical protein